MSDYLEWADAHDAFFGSDEEMRKAWERANPNWINKDTFLQPLEYKSDRRRWLNRQFETFDRRPMYYKLPDEPSEVITALEFAKAVVLMTSSTEKGKYADILERLLEEIKPPHEFVVNGVTYRRRDDEITYRKVFE